MASSATLRSLAHLSRHFNNSFRVSSETVRWASQAAEAQSSGQNNEEHGKLAAACVLERLPVVLPELPEWEASYHAMKDERQEKVRRTYSPVLIDQSSSGEQQDDDSQLIFEPAPRITEADMTDDRRSLNRKLDSRLYLIVKGEEGNGRWQFLQKEYENEGSMAFCSALALKNKLKPGFEVFFVGNAPCGHLEEAPGTNSKLPLPSQLFYFRAQYLGGTFGFAHGGVKDFAWVTKRELPEYMETREMVLLQKMLMD